MLYCHFGYIFITHRLINYIHKSIIDWSIISRLLYRCFYINIRLIKSNQFYFYFFLYNMWKLSTITEKIVAHED